MNVNNTQEINISSVPSMEQVEKERKRLRRSNNYRKALTGTINVLLVVAAVAVLTVTLFLPILQISGTSMEPTLNDGDIIVLAKTRSFDPGELIAFNYSGKVLIKRVIATPGSYVDIDGEGNVFVDGEELDEPYVIEKSLGDVTVEFPYQVPDSSVFVLGDHRSVSVDSRSSDIGCIKYDDIIGRIIVRVWPLSEISFIN